MALKIKNCNNKARPQNPRQLRKEWRSITSCNKLTNCTKQRTISSIKKLLLKLTLNTWLLINFDSIQLYAMRSRRRRRQMRRNNHAYGMTGSLPSSELRRKKRRRGPQVDKQDTILKRNPSWWTSNSQICKWTSTWMDHSLNFLNWIQSSCSQPKNQQHS